MYMGDIHIRVEGHPDDVHSVTAKLADRFFSPTRSHEPIQQLPESLMDPLTTITVISAGLDLIDKFRSMALSMMRRDIKPPSVEAKKKGDLIEISMNGHVTNRIAATDLKMSEWDDVRYNALSTKVKRYWKQFNDIDVALASASPDEKSRLEVKMDEVRHELCISFREMLRIYEKTLGMQLGDHYSLYAVCGVDCPT